ncbi:MAG: AarF/UbiB family protein [Cyanobacteria bacterium P01_H01_bin.35]
MLKKKYIPTPLIEKKKRKKVKVVEKLETRRLSLYYIVWRFILYFAEILFRRFTRRPDIQKTAVQLRKIFEEFGGFWVKTGQILALRTDLLPEEVCDELRKLQYEAVGFPFEVARSIIESELGDSIDKIFDNFDEQPLAAASIAQIYTAVLAKKQIPVVVKVMRPGLEKAFERDLDLIRTLVKFLISLNIATYFCWGDFIDELERTFREELDFRYEASNTCRMRDLLKTQKVYVPKIYQKYSQRRVLVMEYIEGVLMSDYVKTLTRDTAKVREWERENNFDRRKVGENLILSLFQQIFEHNLYHADLHPGNIILLRNNRFVLIDHGSVGSLEGELRATYLNYINALGEGDFSKAADYFCRFGVDIPKVNIPKIRSEMARGFTTWSVKSQTKGLPYGEKSLGGASKGVTDIAFINQIPINWSFLKITRSLFALDGSVQCLVPDIDTFEVIRNYQKQAKRRTLIKNLRPEGVLGFFNQISDAVNQYNYLILPEIRKRTMAYELTVNPFALSMVVILRRLLFFVLISELGIFYTFLYQHHFGIIQPINIKIIDEIIRQIPYIPYLEWLGILATVGLTFQVLLTCSVILERKELNV